MGDKTHDILMRLNLFRSLRGSNSLEPQHRFSQSPVIGCLYSASYMRLRHDRRALPRLARQGLVPHEIVEETMPALDAMLAMLHESNMTQVRFQVRSPLFPSVGAVLSRALYLPLDEGPQRVARAVNPALDWRAIEETYLASEPSVAFMDSFLTHDALVALRAFLHTAGVWTDAKATYMGSYFRHGFANRLLL